MLLENPCDWNGHGTCEYLLWNCKINIYLFFVSGILGYVCPNGDVFSDFFSQKSVQSESICLKTKFAK